MQSSTNNNLNFIEMREISVPIPISDEGEVAEVEVRLKGKKIKIEYRLENLPWDVSEELLGETADGNTERLMKILKLKKAIADYDEQWELIQIFTPSEKAKTIQVLYRKK